ncbi:hypothetical protein BAE44_0019920 [Dichanthelium oligosanthes]|uniref:Uncharacterized protein n=1 Tax=Dichanthelium oligosanthes TaxID=888268 RepID=A0A1E5V1R7_9POAL|nr:hypothetical protein BAE44_0019920 [Dichanthelium oligosanthes]
MVKGPAAGDFVKRWGCLLEELYEKVASAADEVRHLYDKNAMAAAGIRDDDDFRSMMFLDACFLVQYMVMEGGSDEIDESLRGFLSPNRIDILHDVLLLENQLPWKVVQTVMSFMSMSTIPKEFARNMRYCMLPDYFEREQFLQKHFAWDPSYNPPHLLGLLRYYVVGRSNDTKYDDPPKPKNVLFSMSAMELATIGIKLTANETMELIDMRLNLGGICAKLSLAPLTLDSDSASLLVSMAALELCTVESFSKAKGEDSAVCSYLTLLSMLMYREEDVHKLRERDILRGGLGLTNEEALRFFTSFQGMRFGPGYRRMMKQIQSYRERSWMKTKFIAFCNNHKKSIFKVVSGITLVATITGTSVGILAGLKSLKAAH